VYIDGVPLDLASRLLPFRTRFRFSLLVHLHLHAKSQQYFSDKPVKLDARRRRRISRRAALGFLESLESAIKGLKWRPTGTEWADYYDNTNYSPRAGQHKSELIAAFLRDLHPASVWDLGANTGHFSRIACEQGIPTSAFDIDPAAVEKLYLDTIEKEETHLLPLLLDLTNPSPAIGWRNRERESFLQRAQADVVLALALIHHLAIGNNVPLGQIAQFFKAACRHLIIEFVPKSDSQVQRLLVTREDIFDSYSQHEFERCFEQHFTIEQSIMIHNSERTLYLMRRRDVFS